MSIREQMLTVNPSVAPALFRLLMRDADVNYLRENDGIIGFEISLDSTPISGFALIGMRKRTILAYRSEDVHPRLILFPSMEKLFNEAYDLLSLTAKKVWIADDQFRGQVREEGLIADLVKDLTPPQKVVDLPEHLTEKMIRIMIAEHSDQEEQELQPATIEVTPKVQPKVTMTFEHPEVNPVENPYFTPKQEETPLDVFRKETFADEHEIIDATVERFGVKRALLMTLLNALLAKAQGMSNEQRTKQFHLLVIKLLTEKQDLIS